ncbi:MAG TPA: diguanylate cyclase [Steroidobacteraceae bacterium]|nr:diguanylate cyclase [Steroidobacteraceae bacterium]
MSCVTSRWWLWFDVGVASRAWSRLALCSALLLLLCVARGATAQQFTFRQYVQQDGLTNLSVTWLLQDRAGYVWIGTENGLFRHESADFERFAEAQGLEDTNVHSAVEDLSGRLWVGTSHDLYLRVGRQFHPIRPEGRSLTVESGSRLAAPAPDRLLVIDKDELLELSASPGGEVWHSRRYITDEQLRALPALAHLSSLFVDHDGRIWLGCGAGICSINNGKVDAWNVQSGVPPDAWRTFVMDGEGRVWARGLEHVVVLRPGARAFDNRDAPHGRLTAGILSVPMIVDQQGHVLTRSDFGLVRWQHDHWEELNAENGITTPEITALLSSRDGAVWLGMSGHGLWRWLGYGAFESWTVRQGQSTNPVWVVLRGPDHAITMGSRAGCLQIAETTRQAVPCRLDGLPAGEVQVMAKRADNSLWLGLPTGQLFTVASGTHRAVLIANIPQTRKLFVDSTDRLWICSNHGISTIAAGSTRVESVAAPGGLGEVTDAAEDAAGSLWFATQGGLLHWSHHVWSMLKVADPTGAGFAAVSAGHDGWLWAGGASHGLLHLHVRGSLADQSQWIDDPNIAKAVIYFTQVDSRGWLWAGTDDGFALFDGKSWRKFGQADGLIWNDTDQNAVLADADGSIWIGTSGGLTHVIRPERLIQTTPLELRISEATLGTTQLDPRTPSRLKWSPFPALDVHLEDLDFGDPKATLLKVRLRGLSDDWFETHDFHAHYPGLTPGRYVFEAMAVDADHQRASPRVQLAYQILPPWWQTAWFRLLIGALLAALLAAAWKWSVSRLEARRRVLERELKEREALLERATRDALTRLWNRQAILEILAREIATARLSGTPLAVALIDIDHFKRINDTMGHLTGDAVLRTLGAKLPAGLRSGDALGRYGGEELLLVLPQAAPLSPSPLVERLRQIIGEIPFCYEGSEFRVTASLGVAWLAAASDSAEDLIGRADEALYAAKGSGRNRVEYAARAA